MRHNKSTRDKGTIHTLRLVGLDTPEIFKTRFGYRECYGQEASDYLKSYLPIGAIVTVKYYGDDKYIRDLATVTYNNKTLSTEMIKKGYGWVYRNGIKPDNYDQLLNLEDEARISQKGLWNENTCRGERIPLEDEISAQPIPNTNHNFYNNNPINNDCNGQIKGNISERGKIYHMPYGKYYNKTKPEKCFDTETEAQNAGFRRSKV